MIVLLHFILNLQLTQPQGTNADHHSILNLLSESYECAHLRINSFRQDSRRALLVFC